MLRAGSPTSPPMMPDKFHPTHGEGDCGPEANGIPRQVRNQVERLWLEAGYGGEITTAATTRTSDHTVQDDWQRQHRQSAGPDFTPKMLASRGRSRWRQERRTTEPGTVVSQSQTGRTRDTKCRSHIKHGRTREPDHNAHPVEPETEETVPGTEIMASPDIHSAGLRNLAHGEGGDGDSKRNGEAERSDDPKQNSARTGMRGSCDPARADNARLWQTA